MNRQKIDARNFIALNVFGKSAVENWLLSALPAIADTSFTTFSEELTILSLEISKISSYTED